MSPTKPVTNWWAVVVPLILGAFLIALNIRQPVGEIAVWVGSYVLLLLAYTWVVNPHLLGRRSRP